MRLTFIQYSNKYAHYSDVIMGAMVSLITSLMSVYSTVHSCADQRKHQSSVSLAFVRGIHRRPVISPHKWPVTRKMFPFVDVIMKYYSHLDRYECCYHPRQIGHLFRPFLFSEYGNNVSSEQAVENQYFFVWTVSSCILIRLYFSFPFLLCYINIKGVHLYNFGF